MSTATAVPQKFPPMSATSTPAISLEELQRRASYVASANGHNAMEGAFSSPFASALQAQYVAGEIDTDDEIRALKKHYRID